MANFSRMSRRTFCTSQGLPQPALSSSLVGRVFYSLHLVCGFGGEYDGV